MLNHILIRLNRSDKERKKGFSFVYLSLIRNIETTFRNYFRSDNERKKNFSFVYLSLIRNFAGMEYMSQEGYDKIVENYVSKLLPFG